MCTKKSRTTFPPARFYPLLICHLVCLPLITGCLASPTNAQNARSVVLEENFDSEDLAGRGESPNWSGDTADFHFRRENSRTILQLQTDPEPHYTQIRLPLPAVYGSWEFWFRQDFTASNVNRAFVFLLADRRDLNYLDESRINGYAIRTGESGETGKLRLIRFDDGVQHEILASEMTVRAGTGYRVRVERSPEGEWEISASEGYNSTPLPVSSTVTDHVHNDPGFFGLLLRYTTSNTEAFHFDDFRVISETPPLAADTIETADPATLDIYFNRTPDPGSVSPERFRIKNGPLPQRAELLEENNVRLSYSEPLPGGYGSMTIDGVRDQNGYLTESGRAFRFLIISPPEPGDLIINEILYDPIRENVELNGTRTESSGQSEYIEIYNRQNHAVSLEGFHLRDQLSPDSAAILEPAGDRDSPLWISGNEYMLLYPEPGDSQNFQESRVAQFFDLAGKPDSLAIRFDRSTLGLPAGGGTIVLSDSSGTLIDKVDYQPGWHNPNLIDTRGISLERVSPDLPPDDPANWGSSAQLQGGTPGKPNSLKQAIPEEPGNAGLTLTPNPFSPDGDGEEDHLLISYKLDVPDYMVRVRIYDRYGRQVRTLDNSHTAGFEGTVIWDGRTDSGGFVRIGIYIIIFEATHSMEGQNRTFRETVVVARQF